MNIAVKQRNPFDQDDKATNRPLHGNCVFSAPGGTAENFRAYGAPLAVVKISVTGAPRRTVHFSDQQNRPPTPAA